ncbi:hypothetical protein [Bacillus sp. DX1.1]|uniref:hypothetical protein n=1 Tax=Bacillus sp. DX1.1 TaxID=3055866 RepID=UPI0025A088D2|nr:hypothetical protein [Bacillus sp. DX1.1]
MHSMDRGANEFFYEVQEETIFSGGESILDDFEYFPLEDELEDIFWDFYEANDEKISKF